MGKLRRNFIIGQLKLDVIDIAFFFFKLIRSYQWSKLISFPYVERFFTFASPISYIFAARNINLSQLVSPWGRCQNLGGITVSQRTREFLIGFARSRGKEVCLSRPEDFGNSLEMTLQTSSWLSSESVTRLTPRSTRSSDSPFLVFGPSSFFLLIWGSQSRNSDQLENVHFD